MPFSDLWRKEIDSESGFYDFLKRYLDPGFEVGEGR